MVAGVDEGDVVGGIGEWVRLFEVGVEGSKGGPTAPEGNVVLGSTQGGQAGCAAAAEGVPLEGGVVVLGE